jgi:uncharacterized protein YkwD
MKICGEKKDNKPSLNRLKCLPVIVLGVTLITPLGANAAVWLSEELFVVDMVNQQRGFHNLDPVRRDERLHNSALGHSQSMADNGYFSHTTLEGTNGATPADRMRDAGYDFTHWGENIAAGQGRAAPNFNTQSVPVDAAHDVMYGTEDFNQINTFFSDTVGVTAAGWDDLGDGLTADDWDLWQDETNGHGGWMGSRGHRDAILNDLFDDLGVGYVWDTQDTAPILLDDGDIFDQPLYSYWTQHFASGDSNVEPPAPVPLPAAIWLLGSGLAGIVLVGRRKETGGSVS